ncbi:IclR family transcriptional regulator domain-containing protein [Streptomyces katrae]|uniref:IclR family transcriptional regulator domain-containing protein n=1 Tax=Streptomyces katrae TaxID=68223 RepID=UPI0012FEC0C6|nr:IclR family transcriptional regulator C-terminal domain-containing protein [Streptomyces katrae]
MSQADTSWSLDAGAGADSGSRLRYDVSAAYDRLMVSAASRWPLPEHPGVTASEEAERELDTLCQSVVLDPQSGLDIGLLAEDFGLTTSGAVAFGCLLHLVRDEAASFWWEFAAGAGEHEAAYLLMLDHKRRAELRDAELWRERLHSALTPRPEGPTGRGWRDQPLPSAELRQKLHQATRHAKRHEHEDLGVIVLATPRLAEALQELTSTSLTPDNSREDASVPGQPAAAANGLRGGPEPAEDATAAPAGSGRETGAPPVRPQPPKGWTPPPGRPGEAFDQSGHAPAAWEDSLRVLDVLHLIRETGSADIPTVARTAGITPRGAAELLSWLADNSLGRRLDAHTYGPGPLLVEIARGNSILQGVLDQLCADTGAAIYLSTYTDGEILIPPSASGPQAPQVTVTVDFKETPHASAVGKSLLSQLPPAERADLLSRHRPKPLTPRTITNADRLIDTIDRYGPQSPYFDVLEYSDEGVCVTISLPLAGQACSVALSLPLAEHHRLLDSAEALSNRSTGLFLALVLATNPTTPAPVARPVPERAESGLGLTRSGLWAPRPGLATPPALIPHLADHHPRLLYTAR